MFIDQLEMLEAKTKGNLSKQEDGLLKQALAAVRMSFVEAMDEQPGSGARAIPTHRTGARAETFPRPRRTRFRRDCSPGSPSRQPATGRNRGKSSARNIRRERS